MLTESASSRGATEKRLVAVEGSADDLHVRLERDEFREILVNDVVHNDDAESFADRSLSLFRWRGQKSWRAISVRPNPLLRQQTSSPGRDPFDERKLQPRERYGLRRRSSCRDGRQARRDANFNNHVA